MTSQASQSAAAARAEGPVYVPVAKTREIKPGHIKGVRARGGHEVAIANVDGRYFAFEAYCPHNRWPLKWGALHRGTLVCALHLWRFDLATGRALEPPLAACLQTYPVRVEGEVIQLGLRPA